MSSNGITRADVVSIEVDGGELRVAVGDAAVGKGYANGLAFFGVDGFIGFPNDPSGDGSAAQVVYVQDGDESYALGTRDNRFRAAVGTGRAGDRMIVSDCTSRLLLKKSTDTISFYGANQNTSPVGQAMLVQVDSANGKLLLLNGGAVVQLTADGAGDEIEMFVNGGGSIRIHKGGVQITGGDITLVGQVRAGDVGGGNPPLPLPTNAAAIGPGGPVNIVSTKVFLSN